MGAKDDTLTGQGDMVPDEGSRRARPGGPQDQLTVDFGQYVARAASNSYDLEGLTKPLLEALAKLAGLESTYLTVFDWDKRQQVVRIVHSVGEIQVAPGMKLELPEGLNPEALPGVTRSPRALPKTHPDSKVAQRLGLKRYVSVPISVAKHRLFGMLCGASRKPGEVSERIVAVMEFFAQIIADHVIRSEAAETEQRAVTAEEQLRSRARYLAIAEHTLKTPLTSMVGISQILVDRWRILSDDDRTELLGAMLRESKELQVQIDDMLLEARADVQTRDLTPAAVPLGPLVRGIAAAFDGASRLHQVTAEIGEELVAWADPSSLNQVLGLLLDNAIKYSATGGTVIIRVSEAGGQIQIDVVDQGVGVPKDIQIFEPFKRGRKSEGIPGIGLGLHIVRSLVEAMGGSVVARLNGDKGSTLTVRVPRFLPSRPLETLPG